jgi:hypothetical protein
VRRTCFLSDFLKQVTGFSPAAFLLIFSLRAARICFAVRVFLQQVLGPLFHTEAVLFPVRLQILVKFSF